MFGKCIKLIGLLLLAAPAVADSLVLAQLSDQPKKDYKQLRPMVKYVAEQLHPYGITDGEVMLFSTRQALIEAVRAGQVHWITETPLTAAYLIHEANARPLLTKWKNGQQSYQTLIFSHRDSNVKTINDLSGKRIAFEHPDSFSSYYLPRMILEQAGMQLQLLDSFNAPVETGKVGYRFSRNETNNALWVRAGLVEAGALNDGDWQNSSRVPDDLKSEMRIIYRSKTYPRSLEMVSDSLNEERATALKQTLLNLNNSNQAALLHRYEKSTGFSEPQADLQELLREIYHNSRRWQP
ncbi:phosphate/phosphite/phosphonate ABC transporter substrate-binding protein [Neptuniibacter sp. CAU 1671]|uniref:phosphate/phosphite/phosphonate ABC transporter substrate-binding protein n=1 Tax=Neptuniibacter sp. CAU 1671 TaxID=3032593 RepID=UPI0023D9BC69|nr:phosphate/phosphite/phosphonate ABC transporter substrate-binding protein [Neptuniibacter sp. CAU 1671]MDF2182441.1 phosphate/phosphite/phosphonate ABC transporter substrate-binding protein [Neptuniibacter sp. CAU 1671]